MTELIIEGKVIELGANKVSVTKQVGDLLDVSDRRTSFTNKFSIPNTAANSQALDSLGVIGSNSVKPYRLNNCFLIERGIPIVQNGIATISSQNGKGFDCTIQEGNVLLFDAIKGKKLSDLDFSSLNHDLTISNITDSFAHTYSDGYVYALADYGSELETDYDIIRGGLQSPCLFKRWIWDKIFEESGFTYTGDLFDDSDVKTDLVTMSRGQSFDLDGAAELDYCEFTTFDSVSLSGPSTPVGTDQSQTVLTTPTITLNEGLTQFGTGAKFIVTEPGLYSVTGDFTVSNLTGTDLANTSIFSSVRLPTICDTCGLSVDPITPSLAYLEAGDIIEFGVKVFRPGGTGAWSANFDFTFDDVLITKDGESIYIDFSRLIGDMSQTDFLKDFISSEGLIFAPVSNSEYRFNRIKDMVSGNLGVEILSNQFDRLIKRDWKVNGYGNVNRLSYNYEEDIETPFDDGTFESTNENLKGDKAIISRPFTALSNAGYTLAGIPYPISKATLFTDGGSLFSSDPVSSYQYTGNLVYQTKTLTYSVPYQGQQSFTGLIPILLRDEENGQYLLDTNYAWLKDQVDRPERMTLTFNLGLIDIYNWDFLKLYYVDEIGHFFYVNQIKYLTNTDTVQMDVTLIKSGIDYSDIPGQKYSVDNNITTVDTTLISVDKTI